MPGLQPLDFDNFFLFNEKAYSAAQAYKNSRAANLLFSYELARRMQDSGVKVYAICPGIYTDRFCTSASLALLGIDLVEMLKRDREDCAQVSFSFIYLLALRSNSHHQTLKLIDAVLVILLHGQF